MKYSYTAVITPNETGTKFFVRIPDLPGCVTSGKSLEDAIDMAVDAASVWLVSAEDLEDPVIDPTPQCDIPHDPGDILSIILIDTIAYRAQTDTRSVRKNVSLPAWMANLADKRGINCSQVLQEGLLAKLGA